MTATFTSGAHDATKQDAATAATDAELAAEAAARTAADATKQDASTAATDAEVASAVSTEATNRGIADTVLTTYHKEALTANALIRKAADLHILSAADQKVKYEDSNNGFWNFTDIWADATGWTNAAGTTFTTTGNRAYGTTGTNIMTKNVFVMPGTTNRFRLSTRIKWVTGGGGSFSIMVGVTTGSGGTALSGSTALWLDSSGNLRKYYSNADQGNIGGALGASGDVWVTIVGDENLVSFQFDDPTRSITNGFTRTRAQVGSIANIMLEITESRGQSGVGIGPVGFNGGSSTTIPNRNSVEGVSYTSQRAQTATTSDRLRIELPPAYDSRRPMPLFLIAHEYSGNEESYAITPGGTGGLPDGPFYKALLDGGAILCGANLGGDLWGNQSSIDKLKEAYDYVRAHYAISGVVLVGNSMGGNSALGAIAQRKIPASGFIGVCPSTSVVSLGTQCQTNGGATDTSFRAAWNVAANYSDLVSKTAGYDIPGFNPTAFRGVPMWMSTATNDGNFHLTSDVAALGTKLAGYGDFTQFNAGAAGHLGSATFDVSGPAAALGWVT